MLGIDGWNYVRSNDTNGTQRRPDVNRAFTQPSIPSISNRGIDGWVKARFTSGRRCVPLVSFERT
jgi:hypothetical protein